MSHKIIDTHRLVKSEDLNHHGTFFAGRCAEWFVESGFLAVSEKLPPNSIVCLKIHGLEFLKPVKLGETVQFKSRIVLTGRTSLTVFVEVLRGKNSLWDNYCNGFITFCHVDENTKPEPHNVTITASTEEERALEEQARGIINRYKNK